MKLRRFGLPKRKVKKVKLRKRSQILQILLVSRKLLPNGVRSGSMIKPESQSSDVPRNLRKVQRKNLRNFSTNKFISHSQTTPLVVLCGRILLKDSEVNSKLISLYQLLPIFLMVFLLGQLR
jgi:hypothetical protein